MSKTNELIKEKITEELYWDDSVDPENIKISMEDGKVILNGSVSSYRQKVSAEFDVMHVKGVSSVENKIEVKFPENFEIPEEMEIKYDIESNLIANADIDASNVEIFVDKGIVTLEGSVESHWKKIKAEGIASDIKGVISVVNKLAIVPEKEISDQKIAQDITAAINRSGLLNIEDIDIKVKNGNIIMDGIVDSWSSYYSAEFAASNTPGVKDLKNNLMIYWME